MFINILEESVCDFKVTVVTGINLTQKLPAIWLGIFSTHSMLNVCISLCNPKFVCRWVPTRFQSVHNILF